MMTSHKRKPGPNVSITTCQGPIIKSESFLFSELFRRGCFKVPWHQRYYDWSKLEVEALLDDTYKAMKENQPCYFLGAIMLLEESYNKWEINDGQQRMITISLIIAALCEKFYSKNSGSQEEAIALRLLFNIDENVKCTLEDAYQYSQRIETSKNDAVNYKLMICGNSIGTNGQLATAWFVIDQFLSSLDYNEIKDYFYFIIQKIETTCLWIPKHINPNAVFETLNFRGKKLNDFDLIRNYIYSYFRHGIGLKLREDIHDKLENIRVVFPRIKIASEFLRCNFQCHYGFLRKDNFYRDLKNKLNAHWKEKGNSSITLNKYIYDLTYEIASKETLGLYKILKNSNTLTNELDQFKIDSGTVNSPRNLTVYLQELHEYSVTSTIVFALLYRYVKADKRSKKRVAKIVNRNMSRLSTFVVRTALIAQRFTPSNFEQKFADFAKIIATAPEIPDDEFSKFLKDCDGQVCSDKILDDNNFKKALSTTKLSKMKKATKLFLLGINRFQQKDSKLFKINELTVEHILPESPTHWKEWTEFEHENGEEWVYKVGNLTLLGPSDSLSGAKFNKNFENKCKIYKHSAIKITQDLCVYEEWNPSNIKTRQRLIIKQAIQVWKFN